MLSTTDSTLSAPLSDQFVTVVEKTAVKAAQRAAKVQMAHFRQNGEAHHRLLHDVKLEIDRRCEQVIVAVIRERFPSHGILTEESGWIAGDGEAFWIIDPLDGTVNFWHGLPIFCVSIACYRQPLHWNDPTTPPDLAADMPPPITGVVLLPCTNELFVGSTGKGAFLNSRPIWSKTVSHTTDAVVTMSFGKTPAIMNRMTDRLRALLPKVRKVRCLGAVAVELCYVACGYLSGMFYEGIKLWDFAAGQVILQEAGGFLEAAEVSPESWQVYAGAPGMRQGLRSLIEQ